MWMCNPMDGGRWVRQPPMAGKWRTSGTQRLESRRIPARYAALCVPGYGRVPSLCDERVQTEGCGFYNRSSAVFSPMTVYCADRAILGSRLYNRSSAVVARALVSRGRQANPVLTYETALRRFFALAMMHRDEGCNPLFGGFSPMAMGHPAGMRSL